MFGELGDRASVTQCIMFLSYTPGTPNLHEQFMQAIYVSLSDIVIKLPKVLLRRDMIITMHVRGKECVGEILSCVSNGLRETCLQATLTEYLQKSR